MITTTFRVTGLTCGHCAHAVTGELKSLDGVSDVQVDLNPGGESKVTVSSAGPVPEKEVAAALDEAGPYQLVH